MIRRTTLAALVGAACLSLLLADAVHAQRYDYGRVRGGRDAQTTGFIVYLEALATNPRNTDNVVATTEDVGAYFPVIPVWDAEISGRLGGGYRWASGNILDVSVWGYSTDTQGIGFGPAGGVTHFSVGPAICSVDPCAGANGSPGYHDITTEINASTLDFSFGRAVAMGEKATMEWYVGGRVATFEETLDGVYGDSEFSDLYAAAKSNEATMFGVRAAVRGRYMFAKAFSVTGGVAFSALDGEIEASSGLTPISGQGIAGSYAALTDDSRSGTIRDLDLILSWHLLADGVRVYGGWEQSEWRDIAADLMRNLPGATVELRDRDSVTFSSYKLGVYLRF
jgi:hypothetical protein